MKMLAVNVLLRGLTLVVIVKCGDTDSEKILSKNSLL